MTIRNKSSTTTSSTSAATASNAEDSFAAATALMPLSGSRSTNDDNFCLKELAGKYTSEVCYGCGKIIRIPPSVPPLPHYLCILGTNQIAGFESSARSRSQKKNKLSVFLLFVYILSGNIISPLGLC